MRIGCKGSRSNVLFVADVSQKRVGPIPGKALRPNHRYIALTYLTDDWYIGEGRVRVIGSTVQGSIRDWRLLSHCIVTRVRRAVLLFVGKRDKIASDTSEAVMPTCLYRPTPAR